MSDRLELVEQPRLADPCLSHRGDYLPTAGLGRSQRILHLCEFGFAADELGESAPRRRLQTRAQRAEARDLVDVYRLAHALDPRRSEGAKREVALAQLARILGRRDGPGRRHGL